MYFYSFGIFGSVDVGVSTTVEWTDGVYTFRLKVRSGHLFLDQIKTETGFSGMLGVDWSPVWMEQL